MTPARQLRIALFLLGFFALQHLLGARAFTTIFSGMVPADWTSAMLGTTYALSYLCAAVIAPILILAASLQVLYAAKWPSKPHRKSKQDQENMESGRHASP